MGEHLTDAQNYVLETLENGNGFFKLASPYDYSCADGMHIMGERRSCDCKDGWHAEQVKWESDSEPLLWGMNRIATKNLIKKGLLIWDVDQQRGWIMEASHE